VNVPCGINARGAKVKKSHAPSKTDDGVEVEIEALNDGTPIPFNVNDGGLVRFGAAVGSLRRVLD
jgi:hypothetical protein